MEGNKIIAVDLGGTLLRAAVVKNNKILRYEKRETPKTQSALLKEFVSIIEKLIDKDVKAIGIGSPGPLKDGIIKNPPNLPLKNFNLKKFLENKFKKRVEIENDACCVALAEAKLGCKKKNFLVLTLGTGIGGGVIIGGELYKGQGYAGELGHIVLDNGKYLETLWKKKNCEVKKLMEKKGKKQLNMTAEYLGQGIASLINAFDPEVVILGGGVKETGNLFLNLIKKSVAKYQIIPRKVPIKWTGLKHPGTLGASLLVK